MSPSNDSSAVEDLPQVLTGQRGADASTARDAWMGLALGSVG